PDSGAVWLGREEWHEQVVGVGEPLPAVTHPDLQPPVARRPTHLDLPVAVKSGVDRVANEIDQELVELPAVGLDRHLRTGAYGHGSPGLERSDSTHPLDDRDWLEPRLR